MVSGVRRESKIREAKIKYIKKEGTINCGNVAAKRDELNRSGSGNIRI